MTISVPSILTRLAFDRYVGMEGVNWSKLKLLRESPLAYKHAVDTGEDDDAASRGMLRLVHALTLEPENVGRDYALFTDGDRRGDKFTAHKAAFPGRTYPNQREWDKAQAIAKAVREHPVAGPIVTGADGRSEVTIAWTDPETGLPCKGRMDRVIRRPARADRLYTVIDLKTVGSIQERRFAYMVARNGWHCQLAHYCDGLAIAQGLGRVTGDTPQVDAMFIAVEDKPPHDVGVFILEPETTLWAGDEERRKLLTKLAECVQTNHWPGRYDAPVLLDLPAWAFDPDPEEASDHV